jgi:hypothetical protein
MDVSCWEQVLKCSDDGGEIVGTGNKMLKGGDERPLWYGGVLSHSRCLGASSLPLEPRLSVQPCVRPMHLQEPS